MRGFPQTWGDAPRWAGVCFDFGITAAVVTVVAAAASAAAAVKQGQDQNKLAGYNAAVDTNNAIGAAQESAAESNRAETSHRRLLATARATAGASGVDPDSGSPLEVVADLAGQAKLDEELARWQGKQRSAGFAQQAVVDRYTGGIARQTGYMNAATTVLQTASRGVSSYAGSSTRPTRTTPGTR